MRVGPLPKIRVGILLVAMITCPISILGYGSPFDHTTPADMSTTSCSGPVGTAVRPHGGSDRILGAKCSCGTKHTMQNLGVRRYGNNHQTCQHPKYTRVLARRSQLFFQQGPDGITLWKGTMYIIGTLGAKKSVFFGSGRRFRMPPTLTGRSRRTGLASVTLPKSRPTYALRLV